MNLDGNYNEGLIVLMKSNNDTHSMYTLINHFHQIMLTVYRVRYYFLYYSVKSIVNKTESNTK